MAPPDHSTPTRDHGQGASLDEPSGTPTELGRFLDLAIALTSALAELHRQGIVHKAIEPRHLRVDPASGAVELGGLPGTGPPPRDRGESSLIRRPGPPLAYISPEQTGRMNRAVDSRSDLYSLGVVLYELLTGAPAFQAQDALEWVHCHVARTPQPPDQIVPEVPPVVSAIVLRLLAKSAEARYQTAAGLEADLERCRALWRAEGRIPEFTLGGGDVSDRLLIPQVLYGRERDSEALRLTFRQVLEVGATELVMVAGYSGIGKTSLVRELHEEIVRAHGLLCSGKFDQYKRNVPYATIVEAFRELIQQLLTQSEARIADWRRELMGALGLNARLITDIIPQAELIIGRPPPPPAAPLSEAQNRFNDTFRRFMGVFARKEHPLVLFLDDLQWVDPASLKLLETVVTDPETRHLLLIGAYRDNEVSPSHPLLLALDGIRRGGAPVRTVQLSPLTLEDVSHLMADALRSDQERLAPLTALVYQKTGGSPFFVIQFLLTLHTEGLVTFDQRERHWTWDIGQIQAKGYTANVVDLMVAKLGRLSAPTRQALRQAACIGNRFDLQTLASVAEASPEGAEAGLQEALQQGLLLRQAEGRFSFLHDRVQQAAYSLIPEERRASAHLEIGRLLLARARPEEADAWIFDVAGQFNLGAALLSDRAERLRVAQLDLQAGTKAKASAAYAAALSYLATGVELLDEAAWESDYELSFALHKELAEVEFLASNYARSKELIDRLLPRARSQVEKAELYNVLIVQYTLMARYGDAIQAGREALRLLDVTVPEAGFSEALDAEMARYRRILGDRPIASLVDEPEMSDPRRRVALELLSNMVVPARYTDSVLFALVSVLNVNHSLAFGPTAKSTVGYTAFGMVLNSVMNEYQAAYAFGQAALALSVRFGDLAQKCQASFMLGHYLNHWVRHLRHADALLEEGYRDGLSAGEMQWTGYTLAYKLFQPLYRGARLQHLQEEIPNLLVFTRKTRNQWATDTLLGLQLGLSGLRPGATEPAGGRAAATAAPLDEAAFLAACREHRSFGALGRYQVLQAQVRYLHGQPEEALRAIQEAQALAGFFSSSISVAQLNFVHSLTLAALCDGATAATRAGHLEAMAANQGQMRRWVESCQENYGHLSLLVEAELARLAGRELEAERLYERAIRSARQGEFAQDESLAKELASRFYRARGFETIADAYLREACAGYGAWGAEEKVRLLQRQHPWLVEEERAVASRALGAQIGHLDAIAVVKASQAISGEIVLASLVQTLIRVVIQDAGAEKGALILTHGETLSIEAEARVQGSELAVQQPGPADLAAALPLSIVNYVRRTQESVILGDAARPSAFSSDDYLARHRPLSVLCVPLLRQAHLIGMLYLENRLVRDAFDADRVAVLELLAAQAAISLENAALYLERSRAEEALRQSEEKYRALFENSGTALMFIEEDMTISMTNREFERLSGFQREEIDGKKKWTEFVAEPDDARMMIEFHRLRRLDPGAAPATYEFRFLTRQGARRDVVITVAMIPGTRRSLAALLDISERRRAEEERRETESRYRSLVENVNVGVFRTTPGSGRYLQVNPAMVKIFGYDSEADLLSREVVALYQRPEDRVRFFGELAEKGFVKDLELALRKKDGTPIWCSVTATAQLDERGEVRWSDGALEDITERKALEEQLRQAQKMEAIGTLAGGIAHDFNNILTAISGHGSLLRMDLGEHDPLRAEVDEILLSAERAARLTQGLLAFSRKQIISPRPIDLNGVVIGMGRLLRRLIGEDIELTTTLSSERLTVLADGGQLEQVIMNLAANARDAMPRGGVLTMRTERRDLPGPGGATHPTLGPGRYAVLSMTDDGEGMDEATRRRIFEPFFTTKALGKGTGLGLSTVYGIVKQHGGEIEVSSAPGAGTTFTVHLELVEAKEDGPGTAPRGRPVGGVETILVAEDDPAVLKLTRAVLTRFGYTVIEAADGEEAVRRFLEHQDRIGLLILDVVMPKLNGREVYEEIRRQAGPRRVIFTSGYTAEIINQKGVLDEGIDFMAKPVDPATLLARVREALER